MVLVYYNICFILSVALSVTYAFMWHKHFDVYYTLTFLLIPIVNLGQVLFAQSKNLEEAIVAVKIIYLGGCFLIIFIMLSIFSLCHIQKAIDTGKFFIVTSTLIYMSVLTIGEYPLFYKSAEFVNENGVSFLKKEYGFMHTVFYIYIVLTFVISIAVLIFASIRKKDVSWKTIILLVITEIFGVFGFFGGRLFFGTSGNIELTPAGYVCGQIVYLIIINRLCLYDITDSGMDTLIQMGNTGFISFDFKSNYLGSNIIAKNVFPELKEMKIDKPLNKSSSFSYTAHRWLSDFRRNESDNKHFYENGDKTYLIEVSYLYEGKRKRGYQFFITDDTSDRQYINLLDSYNTDLKHEVDKKTAHIISMHDNLIMSMATMVESRDNSTGGHIRRTRDVVKILIDEMKKDSSFTLSDEVCKDIIKAAPMHDLGKIAVDDAVLRKPGRFTDEEYEKMKRHAEEGARIVRSILEGTDDDQFKVIAENIAHYHHERWDGSGYPHGLKGSEIPVEARIMAIADVYDALVSKRVYKEKMSFEKADSIIMEGMGKHFDKCFEKYYVSARPLLEKYYTELEERSAESADGHDNPSDVSVCVLEQHK